jgi:hypothetical protein
LKYTFNTKLPSQLTFPLNILAAAVSNTYSSNVGILSDDFTLTFVSVVPCLVSQLVATTG